MNTKLRMQAKNDFEKGFFKLMNNAVFGKTMENARNHRDIKIVTTNKRRSILASEPNYHSTKYISKDLLIMEMKRLCMNFGMITLSLCMMIKQNYVIKILIVLLYILKLMIFTKILVMMFKDCLILQVIIKRIIDLFQ